MSIQFTKGDIFNSGADMLVNPVNAVGVMGKGLAFEFKKRFPANYVAYKNACDQRLLNAGGAFLTIQQIDHHQVYIANLATKAHWRDPSKPEYIEGALASLKERLTAYQLHQRTGNTPTAPPIETIALPALGAGLGGLDWNVVKPIMIDLLSPLLEFKFIVFEPL